MADRRTLRPRYRRAEEYPSKRFTQRDGRIINWVYEMRFLSREQIQRLEFRPNQGRYCRERLRWLYDEGYLARRRLDLRTGFGANMPIYCLEEQGAEWIALDQKMDRSEIDWRPRDNRVGLEFMDHTLAINEFWIDVVLTTRGSGCELLHWIDERTLKSEGARDYVNDPSGRGRIAIVPDGYFCIRDPQRPEGNDRACFALELDRGTVKRRNWRRKIRAYLEYTSTGKYEQRYGTRSLRVLTVVQTARRATDEKDEERKVRRRVAHIKRWTEEEGGKNLFWFAAGTDIVPDMVLSGEVWQIAGQDGLHSLM